MNQDRSELIQRKWKLIALIYACAVIGLLLIVNLKPINAWIGSVFRLLRPVIWGLILSYLLNPFFRLFERRLLIKVHPKALRRTLSLVLSFLAALLIIALIFLLILPQLVSSISGFLSNYDSYVLSAVNQYNSIIQTVNEFLSDIGVSGSLIPQLDPEHLNISAIFLNIDEIIKWAQGILGGNGISSIISTLGELVNGLVDLLFAIFVAIYLLASKEQRYAQVMKVRRALFSDKTNTTITKMCTLADRSFGGFIEGKLLDSLIIGILTYLVLVIFRIPYPELNATMIGVTNIIPYVGPIFGAIPTSIIILLTEPAKVVPFLIIVVVIQQIDGNIIGPKILGNNTGVSSLCVLSAITIMGSLWGFAGMLLGVPIFATIAELTSADIDTRLRAKGYSSTTQNYYPSDSMVDPAQDVQGNTDKLIKRFERHTLNLQKKQERGEILSRKERFHLSLNRALLKLHVLKDLSDENLTQFTVEEAIHAAELEADRLINEERGINLLEQ